MTLDFQVQVIRQLKLITKDIREIKDRDSLRELSLFGGMDKEGKEVSGYAQRLKKLEEAKCEDSPTCMWRKTVRKINMKIYATVLIVLSSGVVYLIKLLTQ